jgi:hypothetical protein
MAEANQQQKIISSSKRRHMLTADLDEGVLAYLIERTKARSNLFPPGGTKPGPPAATRSELTRAHYLASWHFSDVARCLRLVCYLGKSGHAPPSPFRSCSAPIDAAESCQAGRGSCLKPAIADLCLRGSERLLTQERIGAAYNARMGLKRGSPNLSEVTLG